MKNANRTTFSKGVGFAPMNKVLPYSGIGRTNAEYNLSVFSESNDLPSTSKFQVDRANAAPPLCRLGCRPHPRGEGQDVASLCPEGRHLAA